MSHKICSELLLYSYKQTENCGRFWFQPYDVLGKVDSIHTELNADNAALELFRNDIDVNRDDIVAANFSSDDQQDMDFHRAKIISISTNKQKKTVFTVSHFNSYYFNHALQLENGLLPRSRIIWSRNENPYEYYACRSRTGSIHRFR